MNTQISEDYMLSGVELCIGNTIIFRRTHRLTDTNIFKSSYRKFPNFIDYCWFVFYLQWAYWRKVDEELRAVAVSVHFKCSKCWILLIPFSNVPKRFTILLLIQRLSKFNQTKWRWNEIQITVDFSIVSSLRRLNWLIIICHDIQKHISLTHSLTTFFLATSRLLAF